MRIKCSTAKYCESQKLVCVSVHTHTHTKIHLLICYHNFQYSFGLKMRFRQWLAYSIYGSRVQLIRDCRFFEKRRKPFKQSYKFTYEMCCLLLVLLPSPLLLLSLLLSLSTKSKLAYRVSRQHKSHSQELHAAIAIANVIMALFFMCGLRDEKCYNGVRLKRCYFIF